jgi:hypothetical protein
VPPARDGRQLSPAVAAPISQSKPTTSSGSLVAASADGQEPTTPTEDPDLRTSCQDKTPVQGGVWNKSRFETCIRQPLIVTVKQQPDQKVLGFLDFDLWILGFAYDGSRRVDYFLSVEDLEATPSGSSPPDTWMLAFGFELTPGKTQGDGIVTTPAIPVTERLVAQWRLNSQTTASFTSADRGDLSDSGKVPGRKQPDWREGVRVRPRCDPRETRG